MWLFNKFSYVCRTSRFTSSALSTIYALSSGQGKCGVAVIRISGPKAGEAILKMTKCTELPKPRTASLRHIRDPVTLEELDKGLVLWFPGPKSFTGEDSCEFQIHGGPAVIESVLLGLSKLPNFKPAEAGDFTKRAFFAGKLDLTEVEGLGDLIHAETELQRKQALYQMEGNLSTLYKTWKNVLLRSLAHIEAFIDFSEDENIEDNVVSLANNDLKNLKKQIESHLTDGRRGERLRHGIRTTIIGEPNVGKSSLLNLLCQRPAAIVTPIPGTTRDVIEIHLNVNGFPIIVTDTAGLRSDTIDSIEKEGITRAYETIKKADLILFVIDANKFSKVLHSFSQKDFKTQLKNHLKSLNLTEELEIIFADEVKTLEIKFLFIFNKIDLLSKDEKVSIKKLEDDDCRVNCISCKTEEGLNKLLIDITKVLEKLGGNPSKENPSLTQSRHRYHLSQCVLLLDEYLVLINNEKFDLAAQRLRLSLRHLGKIIGSVNSEEILDVIFKDFCIGK